MTRIDKVLYSLSEANDKIFLAKTDILNEIERFSHKCHRGSFFEVKWDLDEENELVLCLNNDFYLDSEEVRAVYEFLRTAFEDEQEETDGTDSVK